MQTVSTGFAVHVGVPVMIGGEFCSADGAYGSVVGMGGGVGRDTVEVKRGARRLRAARQVMRVVQQLQGM